MHLTRLSLLTTVVGAALILGCGEGRLIFNVDVLSFLNSTDDTIHYPSPIPPTDTIKNPPIAFNLPPGLGGKATVDTVALTVGANVENAAGTGKVKFEIFFSSDSGTLYTSGKRYAQDSATVSGVQTAPLAPAPIPVIGDTSFTNQKIFFGVRITTGAGMSGRLRLNKLSLRIILNDHILTSP